MGTAGTGKTQAYLSIAELARKTKSKSRFYCIDTDYTLDASLEAFPKLAEWDNFIWEQASEFDEQLDLAREYQKKAKRGDWINTDMISQVWESVQEDFTNKIYGMGKADYFMMKREEVAKAKKDPKNFQPLEGWVDWNVIKPNYSSFVNTAVLNNKAHVFACATAQPIQRGKGGNTKENIEQFAHIGARPGGEKRLGHIFHTVLLMKNQGEEVWTIDTGKDRSRPDQERLKLTSKQSGQFVNAYLRGVAGWTL